jgi:hypothetical protein
VAGATLPFSPGGSARHAHPDYAESLYRTFLLMTLNMPDDFPVHPLLRLWCFSVPFLSFLVVSEAVVRLAVLLSSRANSGGRWIKAMAAVYSDHVILCGLGRLGSSILAELRMARTWWPSEEGGRVRGGRRPAANVPVMIADARNEQALVDAGILRRRRSSPP